MLTINPVLSDAGSVTTGSNLNLASATEDAQGVDNRRYTKFDRSASETQDLSMSFSDLLDTLNPLEHIPALSNIYRAVSGDNISATAKIAGDTLYGAILGPISAAISGAGSALDSVFESITGKSGTAYALALFTGDEPPEQQVADASPTPSSSVPALTETPALQPASGTKTEDIVLASADAAPALSPSLPAKIGSPASIPASGGAKNFALDHNNPKYNGSLNPAMVEQAQQTQALAIAMLQGKQNIYFDKNLRTAHLASASPPPSASPASVTSDSPASATEPPPPNNSQGNQNTESSPASATSQAMPLPAFNSAQAASIRTSYATQPPLGLMPQTALGQFLDALH